MIGATFCSGIGAPEIAAPWIDWRFASEIEPFPREVLKQRFGYKTPEDHNQGDPLLWGDMTEIRPEMWRENGLPLPDILVAGTPCQAFSIAGLRKGLKDARGNLTMKFVEICHEIVDARPDGKLKVLWENVPGVLSDSENAFGNFLAGLVGADDSLLPAAKPRKGKSNKFWKWHAGGKEEILDDEGEPTGEFVESKPYYRPKWPSAGMVAGPRARLAWRVLDAQYFGVAQRRRRVFVVVDFGDSLDPAKVLFERQCLQGNTPPRRETGKDLAGGAGSGASHWSGGPHPSLTQSARSSGGIGASNQEIFSQQGAGLVGARMTAIGEYAIDETASTLKQRDYKDATDLVVAFDTTQITSPQNGSNPKAGDPCHPLAAQGNPPLICFDCKAGGKTGLAIGDKATALRGEAHGGGHVAVTFLNTVRRIMPVECARLQGFPDNHTEVIYRGKPATDGPQYKGYGNSMAVPVISWILERMK